MNYNTTYHETLGCEPSTVFHGRTPYNVLDLKHQTKVENYAELRYSRAATKTI